MLGKARYPSWAKDVKINHISVITGEKFKMFFENHLYICQKLLIFNDKKWSYSKHILGDFTFHKTDKK